MMFNDRYGLTQAVISGRKTVTRRVIKDAWWPIYKIEAEEIKGDIIHVIANNGKLVIERKCPYKIGEIVAVAQSYEQVYYQEGLETIDMLVSGLKYTVGWQNKMFVKAELMPHRIQITDIRIERLQDISGDDCLNEGIFVNEYIKNGKMRYHYGFDGFLHEREGWFAQKWFNKPREDGRIQWGYADEHLRYYMFDSPREAFASLIDKVSGKGTWDRNPFVWRIEFQLVK